MFAQRDLISAFVLHVVVLAMLLILNQWQSAKPRMPDRVMQVKMVSLQELQAMMHKPAAKPKPKVKPKKTIPAKPKPALKPKSRPKPQAVRNPKSAVKKKKVVEEELDYDPFAPMEAKPKNRVKKKVQNEQALQEMMKAQISDVELNKYIAGMQQAVERQWKVPTELMAKLDDPLVELKLLPTGAVASVRILESSGSKQLDATLLQAIYAAAPFDIPSQQYALFQTNLIRFHPLR